MALSSPQLPSVKWHGLAWTAAAEGNGPSVPRLTGKGGRNKIRETTPSQGREYIHTAPPKASIQQLVVGWLCVKDVPAVSPTYKFRDRGISGKTLSIP